MTLNKKQIFKEVTKHSLIKDKEYKTWVNEIKLKIRSAQIKAAIRVNTELLALYWYLGKMIIEKQKESKWGDGILIQLSNDLMSEFPEMKGFSVTNLKYIRQWYQFYNFAISPQLVDSLTKTSEMLFSFVEALYKTNEKSPQLVGKKSLPEIIPQLVGLIPWGHNREIISRCKNIEEALFYVIETIKNNWSRNALINQIGSSLFKRQGKAITNFEISLPAPRSDLAIEILKNPYNFDFLWLGKEAKERDMENALIEHLKKFLLELGVGFALVGNQYHIQVDNQDFYIDLLFYHTRLPCYIPIELKMGEFQPEYAGKINFYLSVIDDQIKTAEDNQSIGLVLCRKANKLIAEYALHDISKPIGISEYKLTESIPKNLKGELPSIKEIEEELEEKVLKPISKQKLKADKEKYN